ncbi:hypothetical protein [Mucilaginibacter sp. SJ]|uniref:hypothetical protein n=1 Tax=Mucilaginibacter sp. SJ TaxID=3029053 RepID=UPI0023A974BE|nr:hypothetical protein [Mucilaginibacter sp. SJ]WEA00711.1 hypothetical protein MusilaSJ_24975 [Mucilaginibacter sp. SJ]
MSDHERYVALLQTLKDSYSENNSEQELYLMEQLRQAETIEEFKAITRIIGISGGLFCIPTLMAFSVEKGSPKVMPAIFAITEIYSRIEKDDISGLGNFFTASWWRPRWKGSLSKFISYISCISELVRLSPQHTDETIDTIGEKVANEFEIDLFPFETFTELRLCTPGWNAENDIKKLMCAVDGDMQLISMLNEQDVGKSKEMLHEENILNMRCDYLLTRLNFKVEYELFRYLLKTAEVLNSADK